MIKIEYVSGQQLGECIFLLEEERKVSTDRFQRIGRFRCKCGNEFSAPINRVKNNYTKSCGCILKKYIDDVLTKHGHARGNSHSREYNIWERMLSRCYYEKDTSRKFYIGVEVCERWRTSFSSFFEDMGIAPSKKHSLDRFPNKNGNYEPSNCRWATPKQQANNRSNNVIINYNGEVKTLKEWCEHFNIDYGLTRNRYKKLKWSIDEIFFKTDAA